jgi:hypothetical protein
LRGGGDGDEECNMTPFDKIFRAGAAMLARFRERIGLVPPLAGSEALKRKEIEAERIDRLRNPRDYQGR